MEMEIEQAVERWERKRSAMEAEGGHPSGVVPASVVDPWREWARINQWNIRYGSETYPQPS
jgi:hypothetical protein